MTTYDEANKRYSPLEQLIKYIEEAMMDPEATFERQIEWISVQKTNIDKLYKEATSYFVEKVQPLIAQAKLLDLIDLEEDHEKLLQ